MWRLACCVARLGPGAQYGATLVRAGETWAVEENASWYCGALQVGIAPNTPRRSAARVLRWLTRWRPQPTVELPPAATCVLYYWRSAG